MKCCGCKKEISVIKEQWYGKYEGEQLVKIICDPCIRNPKKKEDYKK